jgi:hypothetical protein
MEIATAPRAWALGMESTSSAYARVVAHIFLTGTVRTFNHSIFSKAQAFTPVEVGSKYLFSFPLSPLQRALMIDFSPPASRSANRHPDQHEQTIHDLTP